MNDPPSVAVMVPLDGSTERNGNMLSVWSSWYKFDYPEDRIKFIFAVPDNSAQKDYVRSHFQRRCEFLTFKLRFKQDAKDRFVELGGIRNSLLSLGRRSDYGFFLDSDVMPPPDTLKWFIEDSNDVVGGVVRVPDNRGQFRLGFGYFRPYYDFSDIIPSDFFRVDSVNTACMFLSKKVMTDKRVSFKIWSLEQPDGEKINISEDHGFCWSAGKAGYLIFVDARVRCKHVRYWDGRLITLVA